MTFSLSLKGAVSAPITLAVFAALLISPQTLRAAPKKPAHVQAEKATPRSIYQQAVSESTVATPRTDSQGRPLTPPLSASSAALTKAPEGMLRLKDSYDQKVLRAWNWRMGLNLQRFGAEGAYTSPNGDTSNLNQVGKTWMPVLEFGISSNSESQGFFSQGLLRGGYARQNLNLSTAYGTDDASLNTVLLALQPQAGYQTGRFGIGALLEGGRLSYSQSGTTSFVSGSNLNRSLDYTGYGLSTHFMLSSSARSKVQAQLSWIQRQGNGEGKDRIQSSNVDGGIAVLW